MIYATGAQAEFGHVAHLTTAVKREPSTLEVQVSQIVRVITAIALIMGSLVFVLPSVLVGMEIKESFIFAIGIIVALVPEGLLPTVTLSLAIGVRRMVKRNALVRRLSAVESLSATTVICTDKTGTLTKNEMTVRQLWLPSVSTNGLSFLGSSFLEVSGAGYDPTVGKIEIPAEMENPWKVNLLLTGAALCSNARLVHPEASSPLAGDGRSHRRHSDRGCCQRGIECRGAAKATASAKGNPLRLPAVDDERGFRLATV